jgi:hypothetical protein
VLAVVATALLTRAQVAAPQVRDRAGQDDNPLNHLLAQPFAGLVRSLQGKGGPAELAQLRVDGDHVYARGVSGEEVRLTAAERAAPRVVPVMRDPLPAPRAAEPPRPPAAAVAAPIPPANPGQAAAGRNAGLEID